MILWTRRETFIFFLIALVTTVLYEVVGLKWLHLPWLPISLVGIAVALIIGFRSNAAYDRIWEARKIWGGIVNSSRSWTMLIKDTVTNDHAKSTKSEQELKEYKRIFVYRHIAWMTALRYAMRQERPWEDFGERKSNREWLEMMHIPERDIPFEKELKSLLSEEEFDYVMKKTNKPAALLSLQSKNLRELKEQGIIWQFSFLELENILKELFNLQGKSERIKNFPYPRQYATLNNIFVNIFVVLLPFGVVPEFAKIGNSLVEYFPGIDSYFIWVSIPFIVIISWVFHTMERIGRVGENPFEGSANDVPISTISRGIEIDIREMIDEEKDKIPAPMEPVYFIQM